MSTVGLGFVIEVVSSRSCVWWADVICICITDYTNHRPVGKASVHVELHLEECTASEVRMCGRKGRQPTLSVRCTQMCLAFTLFLVLHFICIRRQTGYLQFLLCTPVEVSIMPLTFLFIYYPYPIFQGAVICFRGLKPAVTSVASLLNTDMLLGNQRCLPRKRFLFY